MNHACSEEKKDWEEQFDEKWHSSSFGENPDGVKSFIREKLKEQSNTFQKQVNEHCNKRVDAEIALKEEREILAGAIEMSKQGWIDEGRNEMRLKNAGLYRQLFGETNNIYTSKDLWEIFDNYQPLFTEEQKKELKDNLNLIMK